MPVHRKKRVTWVQNVRAPPRLKYKSECPPRQGLLPIYPDTEGQKAQMTAQSAFRVLSNDEQSPTKGSADKPSIPKTGAEFPPRRLLAQQAAKGRPVRFLE